MWKLNCVLTSVLAVAKRSLWLGIVVVLAFTFTSSTDGQTVDKKAKPSGPRAVLSRLEVTSSGAGMVSGSFTTGGYTIYFEAVRGEANKSDDSETPLYDADAPPYGLDIRVMDWNHTPFLVQTADSTPVMRSWADDGAKDNAFSIDPSERLRAFGMLPATVKALKTYAKQEKEAMSDLDQSDLEQVIALLESVRSWELQERSWELQDSDNTLEASMSSQAAVVTYTHKAFIMKKSAFFGALEAEHSAVLLRIYSSKGALLKQQSYCNHGTCATDPSMSAKCFGSFVKRNTNVYTKDRACDQWSSYIFTRSGHGHVCNNDTLQQYLSVKGSDNLNWGICDFPWVSLLAYYRKAPNCQ